MFRDGTKLPEFSLRIDLRFGGLGDCVHRMVPIMYLYKNAPHVRQYVFVYDYLYDLFNNVFKGCRDRVHLMPLSAQPGWLERDWCRAMPYVNFEPIQISTSKPHLTEVAFMEILKRVPAKGEDWNIPRADLTNVDVSSYNLPEAFGVLQVQHTSRVRAWPTHEVEEVVRWMLANKITPVYLGKSGNKLGLGLTATQKAYDNIEAVPNGVLDLRNKTDLLQTLKIIDKAKFIAGVDGGLINLAYMTDTPVIAGFTSILPEARIPFRNGKQFDRTLIIEPDKELECKGCETLQPYVVYQTPKGPMPHDYKVCLYGDYKCVTQMRAAKFIDGIKQVITYKGRGVHQARIRD